MEDNKRVLVIDDDSNFYDKLLHTLRQKLCLGEKPFEEILKKVEYIKDFSKAKEIISEILKSDLGLEYLIIIDIIDKEEGLGPEDDSNVEGLDICVTLEEAKRGNINYIPITGAIKSINGKIESETIKIKRVLNKHEESDKNEFTCTIINFINN